MRWNIFKNLSKEQLIVLVILNLLYISGFILLSFALRLNVPSENIFLWNFSEWFFSILTVIFFPIIFSIAIIRNLIINKIWLYSILLASIVINFFYTLLLVKVFSFIFYKFKNKSFLKLTKTRLIILFLLVGFFMLGATQVNYPTIIPDLLIEIWILLYLPLSILFLSFTNFGDSFYVGEGTLIFFFLLATIYSYLLIIIIEKIIFVIRNIFYRIKGKKIKKKDIENKKWPKWFKITLLLLIVVVILLFNLDSLIINSTINRPDVSCNKASDCYEIVIDSSSQYDYSSFRCLNIKDKYWKPFNGLIKSIFATTIETATSYAAYCTCEANICKTNNLYYFQGVNSSFCNKIQNPDVKSRCLISTGEKDLTLCYLIENSEDKDDCIFKFREQLTLENCKELSDKQRIFECTAIVNRDVSICDKLSEDYRKFDCYIDIAVITKNEGICSQLKYGFDKKKCFGEVARATNDITLCNKSNDNYCYRDIYTKIAIETGNVSYCGDYSDCYSELVKVHNSSQLCDNLTILTQKELCLKYLATARGEYEFCDNLSSIEKKDECYIYVGEKQKKDFICRMISNNIKRDECLEYISITTANVSICKSLSDITKIDNCIQDTASHIKDPSLCPEISDSNTKDLCYYYIRSRYEYSLDEPFIDNICDNIRNLTIKKWCLSY